MAACAPCVARAREPIGELSTSLIWRCERDPVRYRRLLATSHRLGPIEGAQKLAEVMAPITDREDTENGWMVLLDIHGYLRGIDPFARGERDGVTIPLTEAIRSSVRAGTRYGVLVHNHPSGDPSPSDDDVRLTGEMAQEFQLAGLLLLDHVIMGAGQFYSFREGSQWRTKLLTP